MKCPAKSLVVGYGNAYCHDDGVALFVINELRHLLGIPELHPDDDGLDDLGHELDSVMLHQLVPEIASLVADYQLVIFVDAHLGHLPDEVRIIKVREEHRFHAVTHHMSPGMVLSLARHAKTSSREGYLISIKGENFDFGLGVSDSCRRCANAAVQKILGLAAVPPHLDPSN